MTSLLTLSDDIRQNETFKEKAIFLLTFSLNSGLKYIFSQQNGGHVAGDRARTFMSRIATKASSLINSFIFVHCHKQRIVSVYEDRNVH